MFRRVLFILILSLIITSCGAAPAATEFPVAATEEPAVPSQDLASEPTAEALLLENTPTAEPTFTLEPIPTQVLPTPTETPLPQLELPTELPNAPSLLAWDGT